MHRKNLDSMPCPIARSLERVGEWWSILILRDALHGLRRFDEFQKSLDIAPNMLTRRLNALVDAGLLERRRYSERPPRDEYVPTARGRDFRPVLIALLAWGNKHFAPEGASVQLVDTETGATVDPIMVDSATGRPIKAPNMRLHPGPPPPNARAGDTHRSSGRMRAQRRSPFRRKPNAPRASGATHERRNPRRKSPRCRRRPRRGARPRHDAAHSGAAAGTDRGDVAADGVAQRAGDGGAGGDRPDRNLVRGEARHRRTRRHGAGVPRGHADANDLGGRHGRRHLVRHRARTGRRPA